MKLNSLDASVIYKSGIKPELAKNMPITKEGVLKQVLKVGNTPYNLEVQVNMDNNIFVPNSVLNDIRREAIKLYIEKFLERSKRKLEPQKVEAMRNEERRHIEKQKIAVLLSNLNKDYIGLTNIDYLYIPLTYFINPKDKEKISDLCKKYAVYIYTPIIMNEEYIQLIKEKLIDELLTGIKGIVVSSLGAIEVFKDIISTKKLEVVANYSMNVFNEKTIEELKGQGIKRITISPELNTSTIQSISKEGIELEQLVYGRLPLMTTKYCFIGKSTKCKEGCKSECTNSSYVLEDRLKFVFPIIPDRIENTTTILNSKITAILPANNIGTMRIDIQDEAMLEVQTIIDNYMDGQKPEGSEYTNANNNKEV